MPDDVHRRVNGTLVVGSSHTNALHAAAVKHNHPMRILFINRDCPDCVSRDGSVSEDFLRALDPHQNFVSMLHGNYYNVFGLFEHPEPFDIFAPDGGAVGDDGGRTIIPYSLLQDMFRAEIRRTIFDPLQHFAAHFTGQIVHVASPPPVRSLDKARLDKPSISRQRLKYGPAPAALRKRLYDLQSQVTRSFCRQRGIRFIPPPAAALDDAGFLKEAFSGGDPTHANRRYGVMVLKMLDRVLGR